MLANLSTPLLGLVDTAVIGHLDNPAQLGGVALGSIIFSFLFWGFGFLRMGTTGLVAQASGAGREEEALRVLLRAILLSLAIAAAILALQGFVLKVALELSAASGDTRMQSAMYYQGRIWSAPATLMNYVLLAWFLGRRQTGTALALQLCLNLGNIALDLLFVLVLEMGVHGAGLASAGAEWLATITGLLLLGRQLKAGELIKQLHSKRLRVGWTRLMSLNINILLRTFSLLAAFALLTRQGASMGDSILAANAVLLNLQNLMAHFLDAFAHAAEIQIGHAKGKKDPASIREQTRIAFILATPVAVLFSMAYAFAGEWILSLLTDMPAVLAEAEQYLVYAILSPLVSVSCFVLDGVFLGATEARRMRNSMLASLVLFTTLVHFLTESFGNHGLWAAFLVFMASRGIGLFLYYPALLRSAGRVKR